MQRGFFGPAGVAESARGFGLGKALLMKALEALREIGHAYAIIGGVEPRGILRESLRRDRDPRERSGDLRRSAAVIRAIEARGSFVLDCGESASASPQSKISS
jgi:GNAT superfamily N-acetyltransferase